MLRKAFRWGRSPHGERGLKYIGKLHGLLVARRSPHGERGLKLPDCVKPSGMFRRSPHGERGLKSDHPLRLCRMLVVALLMESVD